jgi:hypothetical protein
MLLVGVESIRRLGHITQPARVGSNGCLPPSGRKSLTRSVQQGESPVSKRSFRRLAVVAGAALAVGSMAPAMAVRIDAGAGAEAEIDPTMVVNDVVNITDALPLPGLSALPIPTYTQLNGTVITVAGIGAGTALAGGGLGAGIVDNVLDHATLLGLGLGGSLLGADCGLVAVASCNTTPVVDADIPVNAAGLNVLGGGILTGGPLGGLLDISAVGNVNVLAGLLASL